MEYMMLNEAKKHYNDYVKTLKSHGWSSKEHGEDKKVSQHIGPISDSEWTHKDYPGHYVQISHDTHSGNRIEHFRGNTLYYHAHEHPMGGPRPEDSNDPEAFKKHMDYFHKRKGTIEGRNIDDL